MSAKAPANTKRRLFSRSCFVPSAFHAMRAGIRNIQMLATDFMVAPIHPPANGPKNPTRGALINKLRSAGLRPKIIQQSIHGMATKSILMPHGVTKSGGRICRITASGANRVAPAIFIVGLLRFMVNLPVDGFYPVNLFKSNYPEKSMGFFNKRF